MQDFSMVHKALQAMTLAEQLHDLTIKYQSLEQQFNTLQLETNEYKQHNAELQHQNEGLTQKISDYKQEMIEERNLQPIVNHQICSMRSSLLATNTEMITLKNKNKELTQWKESLQSENDEIKKRNEKLLIMIENNDKQKQISMQINNKTLNNNVRLQNENQLLRDELNIIKTIKLNPNIKPCDPNVVKPCEESIFGASGKINKTIRINFSKTPDLKDDCASFGKMYNQNGTTPRSIHGNFLSTDSSQYQAFHTNTQSGGSVISVVSGAGDDIDELKLKLGRLENENAQLLLQLDNFEKEKEESDMEDMEKLFRKCDKVVKRSLAKKHKKTLRKFQFSRALFGL